MKSSALSPLDADAVAPPASAPASKPRPRAAGVVLTSEKPWSRSFTWFAQCLVFVAVIALWEGGVRLGLIDRFFWSSPWQIAQTAVVFFSKGTAIQDTWFTFRATVIGFVLGSLLGAAIGLSLWWSTNLARLV